MPVDHDSFKEQLRSRRDEGSNVSPDKLPINVRVVLLLHSFLFLFIV